MSRLRAGHNVETVYHQESGNHIQRRVYERIVEHQTANPKGPLQGITNNRGKGPDFKGGARDYEIFAGSPENTGNHITREGINGSGRQVGLIPFEPMPAVPASGPTLAPTHSTAGQGQ